MTTAQQPTRVAAGVDLGGTKVHLAAEDLDTGRRLLDVVLPNTGWTGMADDQRAETLAGLVRSRIRPLGVIVGLVAGVHGSDSEQQRTQLTAALRPLCAGAEVVNDSELLVPAAGLDEGIGVVAGTGSVATGRRPDGVVVRAGGWGWAVGDYGGALGLVRDACRAVLADHDYGREDRLSGLLLDALGVLSPGELGSVLIRRDPREWAMAASVVFQARSAGSRSAGRVIDQHVDELVELVRIVVRRGVVAKTVVAAGGVIRNQPEYFEQFATAVRDEVGAPQTIVLLDGTAVDGALNLVKARLSSVALTGEGRTR